jgi:hypothetical protein
MSHEQPLSEEFMGRALRQPLKLVLAFVEGSRIVNLVLICLCFVVITSSAVAPGLARLTPLLLLAYSAVLLSGSHLLAGTVQSSKYNALKGDLSFLQVGRPLHCNLTNHNDAKRWGFALEAERAVRLFARLKRFHREELVKVDYSAFVGRDCNYHIVMSDVECPPQSLPQECRGVLELPFTCRLNGYQDIRVALAELHKVMVALHGLLLENDRYLNRIDGGSHWNCDKKLTEARDLLLRNGKTASSWGLQLGFLLWGIAVFSVLVQAQSSSGE